ncbi:hypothetical protein FJTKL_10666 [Diaporthe vaccinii]|uniref:Uncharacterized protein n=1 Tax=Diaporthe vaccinii TaxID=105482 RepID=A0ABR4FBD3_9PEZI
MAAAMVTQLLHIAVIVGFLFHFHIIIQPKVGGYANLGRPLDFFFGSIVYLSSQSPCRRCKPAHIVAKPRGITTLVFCALFLPNYKARNEASIPCTPTTMNRQSFKPASLIST